MSTILPPPPPRSRTFNRRLFLKLAAAAGITAVAGDALFTYAPWLDYDKQVRQSWDMPLRRETTLSAQVRDLVSYAVLAPSGHNTQPWKFAVRGDTVQIFPDFARRLPAVDPQDRELWISLGCALENLVQAAQAAGYAADVVYPTLGNESITVHLRQSPATGPAPLSAAIPHRQNDRSLYDGRAVSAHVLRDIARVKPGAGVSSLIFTDTAHKEMLIEYIMSGDRRQFGDPAFVAELVSWMRFNKPEALHSLDGLYMRCTGNPDVPRWLGKQFLSASTAGQQADTSAKKARSSSGLIVLSAASDDTQHWIETGRFYERLALTLTAAGVQVAFLNQPAEVPTLRSQLAASLNLGTAQPQLVLRFGHAPTPLPHSLRRPLDAVLI